MLFFLACVKLKAHRVFSLQAEVVHVSMCIIIKQTFQNDHELHHLVPVVQKMYNAICWINLYPLYSPILVFVILVSVG